MSSKSASNISVPLEKREKDSDLSKVPSSQPAFWSQLWSFRLARSKPARRPTSPGSDNDTLGRAARTPSCLSFLKSRRAPLRPASSSSSASSKTLRDDPHNRPPHLPTPQASRSTLRFESKMAPSTLATPPSELAAPVKFSYGLSPNVTRPRNPRFQLLPATAEDIPELTRIQFNAFLDVFQYEPYHEILYPGGNTAPARAAAAERILEDFKTDKKAQFLKVIDRETGKIAAGGRWTVYHKNPGQVLVEADWIPEEEADRRAHAECVLNGLYRNREKITQGKPYVVLEMLYTDLSYQRQGAGQLIMDWGVSKAEELGYQSILESTRYGYGLYERNGYNGERTWLEVPEKWFWRTPVQYWFMHRPAPGETLTIGNGLSLKN